MPKPWSGEKRTAYISRCISQLVGKEGYDKDQAAAVCYSMWKQNLADRNKVSFDFNGVLTTTRGKILAKRLMASGKSVYIITSRSESMGAPVIKVAKELKIPLTKVIFAGSNTNKVDAISRLKISVHFDDNPDVIKDINDNTGAQGVKF